MLMLFPEERPTYPARPSGALRAQVNLREGRVWLTATTTILSEGRRYAGMARVRADAAGGALQAERLRQRIVRPYRVIYEVTDESCNILGVMHACRLIGLGNLGTV